MAENECKVCSVIASPQAMGKMCIYEDARCVAVLSTKPSSPCHVMVVPRKHATIMEQVSDEDVGHMMVVANKISSAIFETLNIQGTNIFIENGLAAGQSEPHFIVHIVSRVQDDTVGLTWQPKQPSEEQMSTVELSYKQFTDGVVFSKKKDEKKTEAVKEEAPKDEKKSEKSPAGEENYMLKRFMRMP